MSETTKYKRFINPVSELILLAIYSSPDNRSYSAEIADKIEEKASRRILPQAIQTSLDRMEAEGWTESKKHGAARYSSVTQAGIEALQEAKRTREAFEVLL